MENGSSPRAWGRCTANSACVKFFSGSSPRAWGRCSCSQPAYCNRAGSSPRAWGRLWQAMGARRARPVHPHVRGADFLIGVRSAAYHRFIPTCVGQIFQCSWFCSWFVRFIPTCVGQIPPSGEGTPSPLGSSPRAWGRSLGTSPEHSRASVHPHVRGADCAGKPDRLHRARFIPTCVGQMLAVISSTASVPGSSPRAWGRSRRAGGARLFHCGSSPRAWGRLSTATSAPEGRSVHPHVRGADAGGRRHSQLLRPVHPHVRGADAFSRSTTFSAAGSSPRAWGRYRR